MMEKDLRTLTETLLAYTDTCLERFEKAKAEKVKGDFYTEVKPFADEVKKINDQWFELATNWVMEEQPKNLYAKQVESTYEQIELLSVQAFFPDTSRTRFLNYFQSVRFILSRILELI